MPDSIIISGVVTINRGCYGISNEHIDAVDLTTRSAAPGVMSGNAFFGYLAGQSQQVPQSGIAVGSGAGAFNTFIGYQAGQSTTLGDSNVFIGYQAAQSSVSASSSVVIGASAVSTASKTVVIGASAAAGSSSSIIVIGWSASGAGAQSAVIIGTSATASGSSAVAIGTSASTRGGTSAVAIGTSANSGSGGAGVVIGASAGQNNLSATGVVFIGNGAGLLNTSGVNTFIGFESGYTATPANATTTGTGQTCLGWNTGQNVTSATAPNYITCIGYSVQAGASGAVAIGTDHTGAGATSGTQDLFVLGTANHTINSLGKVKMIANGTTSGALSTTTFTAGTGKQVDTTCDRNVAVVTNIVVATDTVAYAISPDNVTYTTLGTTTPGVIGTDITTLSVPAGWYVKVSVTGSATVAANSVYY